MPTTGCVSGSWPAEPKYPAVPYGKTWPPAAVSQYPWSPGAMATPTTGVDRVRPPAEPKNPERPKLKMPPSDAAIR